MDTSARSLTQLLSLVPPRDTYKGQLSGWKVSTGIARRELGSIFRLSVAGGDFSPKTFADCGQPPSPFYFILFYFA